MTEYLLKNSSSKNQLAAWLDSAVALYSKRSALKWNDEDSLVECLFSAISTTLITDAGRLDIDSYKIRGRGPKAPEKAIGADGIGIVHIENDSTSLSGFFLFQAKKVESQSASIRDASSQCGKMLQQSSASYLLALGHRDVSLVSAIAVTSLRSGSLKLNNVPYVSFRRFVVEQLLRGLMLQPMGQLHLAVPPDLRSELRHVLTIIGGRDQEARGAGVGELLADFDFELDRNEWDDEEGT